MELQNSGSEIDLESRISATKQILIWKDRSKNIQLLDVSMEDIQMSIDYLDEPAIVYAKALVAYHCYDLIPTSSKLVVLDTMLGIKKAFLALIYTGVRAAPLWDANKQCYIGMLTITDFIKILRHYYKKPGDDLKELEEHSVHTWREVLSEYSRPLVCVTPDSTLFEVITKLHEYKIHRMPVLDMSTGNILFIVTHKRILRFLTIYIWELPEPEFMSKSLEELNLGTYDKLFYVKNVTPIIDAINLFLDNDVSALPIVNDDRKVVGIISKFDVINLAPNEAYHDLSATIEKVAKNQSEDSIEPVQSCKKSQTLKATMYQIARAQVHRLVVVDDQGRLEGIISLSDILHFLILKPN